MSKLSRTIRNLLLNWTKRLIALRKQYKAFGRGTHRISAALQSARAVPTSAAMRKKPSWWSPTCRASRKPLSSTCTNTRATYAGRNVRPHRLSGDSAKAIIPLTLGPNSFFWFSLEARAAPLTIAAPYLQSRGSPNIPIVAVPVARRSLGVGYTRGRCRRPAVLSCFPPLVSSQESPLPLRRHHRSYSLAAEKFVILLVRAEYTTGDPEQYFSSPSLRRVAMRLRF